MKPSSKVLQYYVHCCVKGTALQYRITSLPVCLLKVRWLLKKQKGKFGRGNFNAAPKYNAGCTVKSLCWPFSVQSLVCSIYIWSKTIILSQNTEKFTRAQKNKLCALSFLLRCVGKNSLWIVFLSFRTFPRFAFLQARCQDFLGWDCQISPYLENLQSLVSQGQILGSSSYRV